MFTFPVTDPPTLFTYLTEEDGPSIIFKGWNPILIILFLYSVIIIEIVLVAYVVYWFWKLIYNLSTFYIIF